MEYPWLYLYLRDKIKNMAEVSMEKCRRDLLWNRLLVNPADDQSSKKKSDADKRDVSRSTLNKALKIRLSISFIVKGKIGGTFIVIIMESMLLFLLTCKNLNVIHNRQLFSPARRIYFCFLAQLCFIFLCNWTYY